MRRPLIAGNWKMNTNLASARELAAAVAQSVADVSEADVLVAPPFPYLLPVAEALGESGVLLGAQDVYFEPPGAFTGEVSVDMLEDVGCSHVIVGHSERRHVMDEADEVVNLKVKAVLAGGLTVILCVGELLEEREAGETESVLDRQIDRGLGGVQAAALDRVVVAYEPVWAIGTGKTATPEQAESAHAHIRNRLTARYNADLAGQTRILYGGSVKPDNAAELMQQPDVDGALVGGASLKAETFAPIIRAAGK